MKTEFVNLTKNDIKEVNKDFLKAFENNFKPIKIEREKHPTTFKIFQNDHQINYCTSIEELNGWLYGCVQANNKRIEREDEI